MADASNTRWYALTLDRVLATLLAIEVLLFLSDRFDWFLFNKNKGWTVLITAAIVAGALVLLAVWGAIAWAISFVTKRRPFQFSLRSMLILFPVIAMSGGWLAASVRQAQEERAAGSDLVDSGGGIRLGRSSRRQSIYAAPPPPWLEQRLGVEFFAKTVTASARSDEELVHVSSFPEVEHLFLDGSVEKHHTYQHFGFPSPGTTISDEGLSAIRGLSQLEKVLLESQSISSAGLIHLKNATGLKTLHLTKTQVDDEGLRQLARHRRLEDLAIAHEENYILVMWPRIAPIKFDDADGERVKLRARVPSIMAHSDWKLLGAESPNVASWGVKTAVPQRITDAGLVHLKGLRELGSLKLCGAPITGTGFEPLQKLDKLIEVNLIDCPISDDGLRHIAELRNLRTLYLSGDCLSDHGLEHLERPKKLRHLSIDRGKIDGSGLKSLRNLPLLESLTLARTKINDEGLANLRGIKSLTRLNLRGAEVTDNGLQHLAELTELEELDLSGTRVSGTGLAHLSSLTKLKKLNLAETPLNGETLALIVQLPSLMELDLNFTSIDDAAMVHLVEPMSLTTLRLAGTKVTNRGVAVLKSRPLLNWIDLSHTQLTDAGMQHLSAVPGISHIDIAETKVTSLGIRQFESTVKQCYIER
jgi:uncharacterized protein YjbI with pentapeptide repeats